MGKITKETILSDLKTLGIQEGDTVFITANLMKVGYLGRNRSSTRSDWISIFKELLGKSGTFMTVSFSKSYPLFSFDATKPFDQDTPTNSGSLAQALLECDESRRSSHPTNSYVAIGEMSKYLTESHSEKGLSYDPTKNMIEIKGKNLMLGTIDGLNAPMVFHYVQQIMGQTLNDPLSGLSGCYYKDSENNVQKFIRRDVGGCSSAGNKLYSYLIEEECISIGKVGNAVSAIIDMESSFKICRKIMKERPNFSMCDDKSCLSCYGRYSNTGIYSFKNKITNMMRLLLNRI
jgi:aminoglycoside N3'-acetyltransferase